MKPESELRGGFDPAEFEELVRVEQGNFWFEVRNELITWLLRRHAPAAENMLEVGCGTGFVLAAIHRAAPSLDLTGTELFPEGLVHARERVPQASLAQMDARDLPYDEDFDVIGAFDVIEHIDDDELVLAEIHRALRPGGVLLVTVPQHRWLWSANDEIAMHERRYTRSELAGKTERAGFAIERMTSFVSLLLPAMALSRLRKRDADGHGNSEFEIGPRANAALMGVLRSELSLIRRGVSLPAGGSLVMAARKPQASGA